MLTRRQLNRATLDRQLLLQRHDLSALQAVEHLVGLQAQAPAPPYFGLWARLSAFATADLAALLTERRAVRIALMRGTIHLVSATDARWLRPLVQPALDRGVAGTFGRDLAGIDLADLASRARSLAEERPRTIGQLGALLQEHWPDRNPQALGVAARCAVPLVQVPPRGVWGASGPAAHTTLDLWVRQPVAADAPLERLVERYLRAFGPASPRDMRSWSGLTGLGEVFDRMRPSLRTFRSEDGVELFDLPDAPRPDPATPAPPRFLPDFDNLLLSHADRSRVLAPEHRSGVFTVNGIILGTVLVDGFVAATWRVDKGRAGGEPAVLTVTPLGRLTLRAKQAVTREGLRLLDFAEPQRAQHQVRFLDQE